MKTSKKYDVVLVGAGIMSATLATLIKQLEPTWKIKIIERAPTCGTESSMTLNNAGTGHSGFCELNYSFQKAIDTCESFEQSKQFWAYLVKKGFISSDFIRSTAHISFVTGRDNVDQLKQRWLNMKKSCLFQDMEFSDDFFTLSLWAPLLMKGRNNKIPVAATRTRRGTDINFGALTLELIKYLENNEVEIQYNEEVNDLKRNEDGGWNIVAKNILTKKTSIIETKFLFIGAGGAALTLLQKSGIPEAKGYGGFPVSGQWLVCDKPEVVNKHFAKVYGKPEIGSPPMSTPHLDTRFINQKKVLIFGPYAGFSTKFLKQGHWTDFFKSLKLSNVFVILSAGLRNLGLSKYLIREVTKTHKSRFKTLLSYYPSADINDWKPLTAGQRVQIIKKDNGIPTIEFGTEIVASEDGSIAALLGASPGASVSVKTMLEVIETCLYSDNYKKWKTIEKEISLMIPSFDKSLHDNEELFRSIEEYTSEELVLFQPEKKY